MTQLVETREAEILENHVLRYLRFEDKLKVFIRNSLRMIQSRIQDSLETPRELVLLYEMLLSIESPHQLKKVYKFVKKYNIVEKYPWLSEIAEEVDKLIREYEELEEEEIELHMRGLL